MLSETMSPHLVSYIYIRFSISGVCAPRMSKRITVRVVECTSLTDRNVSSGGQYNLWPFPGLLTVVQLAYPSFPRNSIQVNLRRDPAFVLLWTDGQWRFSKQVMYNTIQDGNVVEVLVNGMRPAGPDTPQRHWVSDGAGAPDDHPLPQPGRAVGPEAVSRRVRALLQELQL